MCIGLMYLFFLLTEQPKPNLIDCKNPVTGESVPTGTGSAKRCKAMYVCLFLFLNTLEILLMILQKKYLPLDAFLHR